MKAGLTDKFKRSRPKLGFRTGASFSKAASTLISFFKRFQSNFQHSTVALISKIKKRAAGSLNLQQLALKSATGGEARSRSRG